MTRSRTDALKSGTSDVGHRHAQDVRASKKPCILKVHGETLAVVMPVGTLQKPSAPKYELWANYDPQHVHEALQNSTKTLADVDKNQLLTDIAQQREKASSNII